MGTRSSKAPFPLDIVPLNTIHSKQASSETDKSNQTSGVQYLLVFFKFASYLRILPICIEMGCDVDGTPIGYKVKSSSLQRIAFTSNMLFGGIYYACKFRQHYTTTWLNNPAMYFNLANYLCDTLLLVALFINLGNKGFQQKRLLDTIDQQPGKVDQPGTFRLKAPSCSRFKNIWNNIRKKRSPRLQSTILCWIALSTMFLYLLEIRREDNNAIWHYFYNDAAKVFNMIPRNTSELLNNLLAFIALYANCLHRILNAFGDMLFVLVVLLFHLLVANFTAKLASSDEGRNYGERSHSPSEVFEHFRWLRHVTAEINSTMSVVLGFFVVGNLPFYATNLLDTFRDTSNPWMRLRYSIYCSYFFPSLFLAARAAKKVEAIRNWAYRKENHAHLDPLELSIVLHEVSGQPISLSSFGCLTINYRLFGSVVSVIVTYALLKTQFYKYPEERLHVSNYTMITSFA